MKGGPIGDVGDLKATVCKVLMLCCKKSKEKKIVSALCERQDESPCQ